MATVIQSIDPKASGSDTDDSDFAASDSYGSDYDSSTSEGSTKKVKSRKIAGVGDEALASGDEGIVEYGRRKQKRKHKKSQGKLKQDGDKAEAEEDESAGEEGVGVRLKRRREGKAERETKKRLPGTTEAATVDIDDIWKRLNSPSAKPTAPPPPLPDPGTTTKGDVPGTAPEIEAAELATITALVAPPETIMIKRTFTFAGTTTIEEKLVPRESAEARLYLASQRSEPPQSPATDRPTSNRALRRPLRRPSRFDEPNPPGGISLKTPLTAKSQLTPTAVNNAGMNNIQRKLEQGQKLNTVEKSRMDWAGYVDKEKLKDELDKSEKAKGAYLDRMDFLGRSEQAREEVLREGRTK